MENLEQSQPQPEAKEPTASPVPQPVSQAPAEPKPSMVLPIVLSLVMFVLGGALVFAYFSFVKPQKLMPQATPSPTPVSSPSPSPSPDVTADWQVYRNEKYKFSIRYSKNWQADEKQIPGSDVVVTFNKKGEQFQLDLGYGIEIEVRENPQGLSDKEWAEAEAKSTGGSPLEIKSRETTVAGIKTFVFSGPLPRWTQEVIYLPNEGKIYIIRATNNLSSETVVGGLKKTFNLMLQTFKFTE